MSSVEERLAKVEREVALLLIRENRWPIAELDEKFKDDPVLKEIFSLAKEDRNADQAIKE